MFGIGNIKGMIEGAGAVGASLHLHPVLPLLPYPGSGPTGLCLIGGSKD